MSQVTPRFLVAGASGKLGRLVLESLLERVPAASIVAGARHSESLADFASRGVTIRELDYENPETIARALNGIDRLLLISSSAIGQRRIKQHGNVIAAAAQAGVKVIAYTSVLHCDRSTLLVAADHGATEAMLAGSGVPFVLLRNGWYTENYTATAVPSVQRGAVIGSSGSGRLSAASRADYALAAAAALIAGVDGASRTYELAGDTAFTRAEYAAELSKQSGKSVVYSDLPREQFREALVKIGLLGEAADVISGSDAAAAEGALFDDSHHLSRLIGRPTTTLAQTVKEALAAAT